jgi:hypothetical protein
MMADNNMAMNEYDTGVGEPDHHAEGGLVYRFDLPGLRIKLKTDQGGWRNAQTFGSAAELVAAWGRLKASDVLCLTDLSLPALRGQPPAAPARLPAPEEISAQYGRAQEAMRSGVLEAARFGAMLLQVDEALGAGTRNQHTEDTLKSWLTRHCPEIPLRTAERYKQLAEGIRSTVLAGRTVGLAEVLEVGDAIEQRGRELPEGETGDADGTPEPDAGWHELAEAWEDVKGLVFGKSARQLLFSFAIRGGRVGRPKGSVNAPESRRHILGHAEREEMETVSLEGMVRDLHAFFSAHRHLMVLDRPRREACRLALRDFADLLK